MLSARCCSNPFPRPSAQSIKDLPILQDAPPPGGFPSIRIERRIPNTGPTGTAIFAVTAAIVGYGFYQVRAVDMQWIDEDRFQRPLRLFANCAAEPTKGGNKVRP